jgi:DNA invertase Pin-like site-specific DNA recombinase
MHAAQYLRMSTEHQRYSLSHQAAAIAAYAARRGYSIVTTYADSGRSGLRLETRDGLKALLHEVLAGSAAFQTILVYDVSRWGRFQDPDQSAHYEFICREAGVQVVYCAEPFENDGSVAAGILKHVKRIMAAEYSRELSAKVLLAQRRLAAEGFWQGGPPGYGLRRQTVDSEGRPGLMLSAGEHKAIQSHRVLVSPGSKDEIRVIRRIYRLYVHERRPRTEIARLLRKDGGLGSMGRAWTPAMVKHVLTSECYVGNTVFHRHSRYLGGPRVRNDPIIWVRAEGALRPIISKELFAEAQEIRKNRILRLSEEETLRRLKLLLEQRGRLTSKMIKAARGVPSPTSLKRHFGSIQATYKLVGYAPKRRVVPPLMHRYEDRIACLLAEQSAAHPGRRPRFSEIHRTLRAEGCKACYDAVRETAHRLLEDTPTSFAKQERHGNLSNQEMLDRLAGLRDQNGHLSGSLIQAAAGLPNPATYRKRFGSLLTAYEHIGYAVTRARREVSRN